MNNFLYLPSNLTSPLFITDMLRPLQTFPLLLALLIPLLTLPAQAQIDRKAQELVYGVRLASTLQKNDLTGTLRKNGNRTPIGLFLRGENIQFQYQQNDQWNVFHMRMKNQSFQFFEIINGKNTPLANDTLTAPIVDSDLTYEDLAFRFLYWPDPKIIGEDTIKLQKCYKIRLENPTTQGRYKIVHIWVHQKYNALMQIAGYDNNGKLLKRFHVTELMKVKGGQTLKKMNVESYDPKNGKTTGITYLEFNKPKAPEPKGL